VIAEQGAKALVDEHGKGPKPGQLWKNPDLANTYKRIAEHGAAKGGSKRSVGAVQCS
jgi:gamma-glutamyltranspeptidase